MKNIYSLAILFFLFSCKKNSIEPEKSTYQPNTNPTVIYPMSGNYQCIGGDTMYTNLLKLSFVKYYNNGNYIVDEYSLSYNVYCYTTYIEFHGMKKDTIMFHDCQTGLKTVKFIKIN